MARWAGQREKRRAEIVTAALAAITEQGPRVSTEQIAEHAGIARPRLYRHFTDADDLYAEVARHIADSLVSVLTPVMERPSGSAREIITGVVRTAVVWLTDNDFLYQFVTSRSIDVHPGTRQLVADARGDISGLLRRLLTGYLDLLGVDARIADPLAFGVVGMVEATTARWLVQPGEQDRDGLITWLSEWVWGAFDTVLRSAGVVLDPDLPLPPLPNQDG